jgi:hypothetical protein
MSSHEDVVARLEHIKSLWDQLRRTRPKSRKYRALVEEIHAESAAYLAVVDAVRSVDAKTETVG